MTSIASSVALAVLFLTAASSPHATRAFAARGGVKVLITGDFERGSQIADKWCVSCHGKKGAPVNDQVPSFARIAVSPAGRANTLRAFLNAPHKPMPPLQLTNQEIEDLVVFISRQK